MNTDEIDIKQTPIKINADNGKDADTHMPDGETGFA
jgi:hypothetical protein